MSKEKDVAEEYTSSLSDLTVNSKPLINMLTMLAEDYINHAPIIVQAVEHHLQKVPGEIKLPVLYLIDSIVKNVGKEYIPLFTQNIVSTFTTVFEKVDEKTRSQMFKLRQTWMDVFPSKKLYALDARVNAIDPAWPITASPPHALRIHVNPKFFQVQNSSAAATNQDNTPPTPHSLTENPGTIQEEILKQRKELLELQKKKVELELYHTKAILEERQKKLETQTASLLETSPHNLLHTRTLSSGENDSKNDNDAKPKETQKTETTLKIRDPRIRIKGSSEKNIASSRIVSSTSDNPINVPAKPSPIKNKKDRKHKRSKDLKIDSDSKTDSDSSKSVSSSKKVEAGTSSDRKLDFRETNKIKGNSDEKHSPVVIKEVSPQSQILKSSKLRSLEVPVKGNRNPNKEVRVKGLLEKDKVSEVLSVDPSSEEIITFPPLDKPLSPKVAVEALPSKKSFGDDNKLLKNRTSNPPNSQTMTKDIKKITKLQKRKRPHDNDSNTEEKPSTKEPSPSANVMLNAGKDVDLRLLAPQNKHIDAEPSPTKENRSETLESLFGNEDVDLRTFPLRPRTPPPPIISKSDLNNEDREPLKSKNPSSESWANFKGTKSDSDSPYPKKSKRTSTDRLGRPYLFSKNSGDEDESKWSGECDSTFEERTSDNCNEIIKQAEEGLNNGSITFAQYNSMLKEVMKMNETQKLKEAVRRDELNETSLLSKEDETYDVSNPPQSPETGVPYSLSDHITHPPDTNPPGFNKRKMDESTTFNGEPEFGDNFHEGPPTIQPDIRKRAKFNNVQENNRMQDRSRFHGRFDAPAILNRPMNNKSWMPRPPRGPHPPPPRGDMNYKRWLPHQGPPRQIFDSNKPPFRFRGPMLNNPAFNGPRLANMGHKTLPPADPQVLDAIAKDTMKTIIYEGVPREVRFYGATAVAMLAWDNPREISFQPGSKTLIIDDREMIVLHFNAPYQDFMVDGIRCQIRLGAPTRELYIDGLFYEVIFGGPPIQVMIGGRMHSACLTGPTPHIRFSEVRRTDLVAGKVNLIVDANEIFSIYLDAKPQRFEINRIPYILRFVEALQTVVINGIPFKIEFGGTCVPIYCQGEKHFLRLSVLPRGIRPGYISIINMEGGRLPSPPPVPSPPNPPVPPQVIDNSMPVSSHSGLDNQISSAPVNTLASSTPASKENVPSSSHFINEQPLELLASLMPTSLQTPCTGQNYTVDFAPSETTTAPTAVSSESSTKTVATANTVTSVQTPSFPDSINVSELLKKLVAVGIVPAVNREKENTPEAESVLKLVDFSQPESLKVRQPGLIAKLYSGIQCSSCGVRFSPEQTVKYTQHLDWHFRQNRRDRDSARVAQSRRWNYDVSDWIQYQEIEDLEERAQSWFEMQEKKNLIDGEEVVEEEPSVTAESDSAACFVCHDQLDIFYNEEKEEWQFKRAIKVDGKFFHPLCYKDHQENAYKNNLENQHLELLDTAAEEGDTIEIVDDTINECTVISIDDEKEEKSEPAKDEEIEEHSTTEVIPDDVENPEEDMEKEHKDGESDNDSDIISMEVLQPTIESFEILDDDDDESNKSNEDVLTVDSKTNETEDDSSDVEMDFTNVKIKKEKEVVIPEPALTSHHTTVISSIDGNVELEEAAPLVQPKKIKININSSSLSKLKKNTTTEQPQETVKESNVNVGLDLSATYQPPPPGEEPTPSYIKPKIYKSKMTELPPVSRGTELSGLCSIM